MSKFAQGTFHPKNPAKYVGRKAPRFRSSWEFTVMNAFDTNPNVVNWASEAVRIPYIHPLTGKRTEYVPDFLVVYIDKNNKQHVEMIEVKPLKQSTMESARTNEQKAVVLINQAKWQAAAAYCKANRITFRVISEHDIYRGTQKKAKK